MLETILRTLSEQVRTTVHKECGNTARHRFDTSDVVQESLIQIWLNLDEADLRRLIECKSWLRKIALGHRAKLKRRHLAKKRSVYMESLLDNSFLNEPAPTSAEAKLDFDERVGMVMHEMENLEELDQQIVIRYIFENESFLKIAFDIERDSQFVRRRYKRAIRIMSKNLGRQGISLDEY